MKIVRRVKSKLQLNEWMGGGGGGGGSSSSRGMNGESKAAARSFAAEHSRPWSAGHGRTNLVGEEIETE